MNRAHLVIRHAVQIVPYIVGLERFRMHLQYWGKGKREGEPHPFHPVAFHSIDVAAVADTLLKMDVGLAPRLADLAGTSVENIRRLCRFITLLHDIGKFHVGFQAKDIDLVPVSLAEELRRDGSPSTFKHASFFSRALKSRRIPQFEGLFSSWGIPSVGVLDSIVSGHHGEPVDLEQYSPRPGPLRTGDGSAFAVIADYVDELLQCGILNLPDDVSVKGMRRASMPLSGFLSLCDWMASSSFPYASPEEYPGLSSYWVRSLSLAESVVRDSGVVVPSPAAMPDTEAMLEGKLPRPMQVKVMAAPVEETDGLYFIEDGTGSGKTQAAIMLAQRLMSAGRADGLYFALPTGATADGIYKRMASSYARLFDPCSGKPSFVLAHSRRHSNRLFVSSIGIRSEVSDSEGSLEGACSAFISSGSRLALLASVGVGTIDQAVMSVLPIRYTALRSYGLFRKIVVIDEAHSYDTYLSSGIHNLVRFQAMFGMPVVVLSATMTSLAKQKYIDAYLEGRRARGIETAVTLPVVSDRYPLLTRVGDTRIVEEASDFVRPDAPPCSDETERRVPVRIVSSESEILDLIRKASSDGLCVVWYRNTVRHVQDAAALLEDIRPLILHSRFMIGDRASIEGRIMDRFRVGADVDKRKGGVVVASQVLEQSLDLDFDVVISDLAPIDSLLQRAGRFRRSYRSDRPSGFSEFVLHVNDSISPDDFPGKKFDGLQYVYRDPLVLWRTLSLLMEDPVFRLPDGIRSAIARVYADESFDSDPRVLVGASLKDIGRQSARGSRADNVVINHSKGYVRAGNAWEKDLDVDVRGIEHPSTTVRLGLLEGDRLVPVHPDGWAESEIALKCDDVPSCDSVDEKIVRRTKNDWPRRSRGMPVIVCEAKGGVWELRLEGGSRSYDRSVGLRTK